MIAMCPPHRSLSLASVDPDGRSLVSIRREFRRPVAPEVAGWQGDFRICSSKMLHPQRRAPRTERRGKGHAMTEMTYNHEQVQALGSKLDRLADDLTPEEQHLLATIFAMADQQAAGDPDLAFSDRLTRVVGTESGKRIDAGAFHVIV
jgi:hypothetical protein